MRTRTICDWPFVKTSGYRVTLSTLPQFTGLVNRGKAIRTAGGKRGMSPRNIHHRGWRNSIGSRKLAVLMLGAHHPWSELPRTT